MAVVVNATMYISVNGVVNPENSSVIIEPSDHLILGIVNTDELEDSSVLRMGISVASPGPGSLDASRIDLPYGGLATMTDNAVEAGMLGLQNPFIALQLGGQVGILADDISFHCNGIGDVKIAITDDDGNVLDTQVIHQVPEPITIALLGLGGLFLRRRIA